MSKKNEVTRLLNNREIIDRVNAYLGGDKQKIDSFRSTFLQVALSPILSTCSAVSLVQAGLSAAELNLPLTPALGYCYIVKYKKDAQFSIGYKGWQVLLERNYKIGKARPVYKCDKFEFEIDGFNEVFKLDPNFDEIEDFNPEWVKENLRGIVISLKDLKSGVVSNTFVSAGKIKQIVGMSPAVRQNKYSPHTDWTIEMYMAKAIKYVLSKTVVSPEIAKAIEIENILDTKLVEDSKKENLPKQLELPKQEEEILADDMIPEVESEEVKNERDNNSKGA